MAAEAQTNGASETPRVLPRLRKQYDEVAAPALREQFGYKNRMQIPKIEKVVINIGMGEAVGNAKALDNAVNDIQLITGQKPVVTRAKRSIAQFKLRAGMPIGVMVTLRGARMYEFIDRLFNIAMPRVRDFRGLSPDSFDGRGNYTLGLKEQLIFPEIEYDKIDRVRGMEISFVTSAKTDAEGRRLLEMLGMPYARPQGQAGGVQRIAS
jgi:large subunit ribosomal protein L5